MTHAKICIPIYQLSTCWKKKKHELLNEFSPFYYVLGKHITFCGKLLHWLHINIGAELQVLLMFGNAMLLMLQMRHLTGVKMLGLEGEH